ncbi:MAG TPA: hypothetical protein VK891_16110 [Euzebyales bacterium]|nr:hypothetical protein [Euzebyales bacterium]
MVVLFAVFIWFRNDAALVGALSAAGTVVAGGFAAIAALSSMRAAAESSASAKRSREAFARSVRPRIQPDVRRDGDRLLGAVQCGEGHAAVDVTVAWILSDRETVVDQVARLEPWRPDLPSGEDNAFGVDLGLPASAKPEEAISMIGVE